MPALQTCPERQILADYASGKLGDEESEFVAMHIRGCGECLARLDGLGDVSDVLLEGLRLPGAFDDPYLAEDECHLAVARSARVPVGDPASSAGPDLGTLRDYQLIRELGRGGMGEVYEAIHVPLDRRVALKVLPPGRMENREAVSRFRREMRAIGKLDHVNIVRALDAGKADGKHYLVMEHVDGLDVATVARWVGRLPVADACEIIRQAAAGLQYVHDNGLVHRDVKPSNLMTSHQGQVKLLDLGLALLSESLPETDELTSEGQVMGTLDYMAPEQFGDAHEVDTRADVYSLGATFYRLLTGRAPYADSRYKSPTKKLAAIATKPVEPIADFRDDVPQEVADVVDRMMAKNPDDRYATAGEVGEALAPFADSANLPSLLAEAQESDRRAADVKTAPDQLDLTPESVSKAEGSTVDDLKSALVDTRPTQTAPIPPIVESAPKGARPGHLNWVRSGIVAVAAALVLIAFASTLYYVATDNGTLVVELFDNRVDAILKEDGLVVYDRETKREYKIRAKGDHKLPSGEYVLKVSDDAGLTVDTNEFSLSRNGRALVRIRRAPQPSPPNSRDRELAEWALGIGGKVSINASEASLPTWDRGQDVVDIDMLPSGEFELVGVTFESRPQMDDAALERLRNFDRLTWFTVSDCPISDEGMRNISTLANLQHLSIYDCSLTAIGLQHLQALNHLIELHIRGVPLRKREFESIVGLKALDTIYLTHTWIEPGALAQLAELPHLRQLGLGQTNISDDDMASIYQFPRLGQLLLEDTAVTDTGIARLVQSGVTLNALYLDGTKTTDRTVDSLAAMQTLAYLRLPRNAQITDAGADHLAILENLHTLAIASTGFSDEGVIKLIQAPNRWENLDLGDTDISDRIVEHLVKCDSLRELDIHRTDITRDGYNRLKESLPNCNITWQPRKEDRQLSRDRELAEWALRLGGTISVNTSQDSLPVWDQGQAVTAIEGLPRGNFRLVGIRFANNSQVDDSTLEQLRDFDELTWLELKNCPVSDEALDHIATLKHLQHLFITSGSVTAFGLRQLDALDGLMDLRLSGIPLHEPEIVAIADLEASDTVYLNNASIEPGSIARLARLPRLRILALGNTNTSDADMNDIHLFPHLEQLVIDDTDVTDSGIKQLVESGVSLQLLYFRGTPTTERAVELLALMPSLRYLSLGGNERITDAAAEHLAKLVNLHSLEISNTLVSDQGITKLFQAPNSWERMNLSDTRVSDAVVEHLIKCESLLELDIRRTQITQAGHNRLKEALPNCTIAWEEADDAASASPSDIDITQPLSPRHPPR